MDKTKKQTILIVEDEKSLCNALSGKFIHEGFVALVAKNGEEGLKIALSAQPDLILLDIVMPVMDGIAMLKKVREDEWGKDAKVIILTNLNDNESLSRALALGLKNYIVKSDWKIEDVVAMVREKLANHI